MFPMDYKPKPSSWDKSVVPYLRTSKKETLARLSSHNRKILSRFSSTFHKSKKVFYDNRAICACVDQIALVGEKIRCC